MRCFAVQNAREKGERRKNEKLCLLVGGSKKGLVALRLFVLIILCYIRTISTLLFSALISIFTLM